MLDSVRIRLTAWYAAVLTCVLFFLASATYFILAKNSIRRADNALMELADSFLTTVHAELHDQRGPDAIEYALHAAMSEHNFRDFTFAVFDQQGKLIATSEPPALSSSTERDAAEILGKLDIGNSAGANAFQSIERGGRRYRSYARRFQANDKTYALFVIESLHREEEFLEAVRDTFAFTIPLAILLAGIGGYFLARRSLSPVVAMSAKAGRISASNLHERLPVKHEKDELGHLAVSFNQLLDRLDDSFERQKRFVADASHELRTPVAILCGEAEVALSRPDRTLEDYRGSLDVLRAEAAHLKRLVEDLFTLARADAGQYPLSPADFYLDELVTGCCHTIRTLALAKQINITCESPQELLIRADEALLRRMLLNLLDNAIKYTPAGGSVTVRCARGESEYRLSVSDTGCGISPELQPRIFERFFRADRARGRGENDGGAGLGLAICRWIAEIHRGRIEFRGSQSEGSTFIVHLPVSSEASARKPD
ncbi:MAG TPA: heavy metal sensor histidine kinase [Candidatus Acidoferrum sp.]|nr:heavy metal sensor histidine kinase [Candidatus Acidoferrum sp.]